MSGTAVEAPARARVRAWWIGAGVVLIAINLRPAVVGVSPLLAEIRAGAGLSTTAAGVLTALPVLCFGLLAPVAPRLARAVGIERALFLALVVLCAGFAVRSLDAVAALFAGTAVIGAAIATGNVLLPALIKRDFAHRTGLMTGLFSMSISAGGALAAAVTVPVVRAAGLGWRAGLGGWGVFVGVALLWWLPQVRGRGPVVAADPVPSLRRSPLAWQVTALMGLQSLSYYASASWLPAVFVERGIDASTAGLLLSLTSVTGVVGGLLAPTLAARLSSQSRLAAVVTGVSALGMIGVLAAPGAEVAASAVLGLGQGGALGLALMFMSVRAPDGAHAARLSGMAQSIGYTVAASGPFAMGALHDLTGSWTVPFLVLIALFVPQAVAGMLAGRDRLVRAS